SVKPTRFWQVYRGTAVLLVATGILWLQYVDYVHERAQHSVIPGYGWPVFAYKLDEEMEIHGENIVKKLAYHWKPLGIAIDVAVLITIPVLTALISERLIRRGETRET